MIVYPISRGRFVNFGAIEFHPHEEGTHFGGPWVTEVDPPYVRSLFHGWGKEVGELVHVSAGHSVTHLQSVDDIVSSVWAM
jgi:hypothetical protein